MSVGLSTYCFTWRSAAGNAAPPTVPEMIRQTRALGAAVLQICDYQPLECMGTAELEELRGTAATEGVSIELGTRGVEPETMTRYLELAQSLDAGLVRTMYARFGEQVQLPVFQQNLAAAGTRFGDAGIRLAVETYEMIPTPTLVKVLREIDNPWIGVCLDPANSLAVLESPQQVIADAAPLVSNIHVKDFGFGRREGGSGFEVTGRRLGEGQLDYVGMLDAVPWQSRNANFILEHWLPWQGSHTATCDAEAEWTAHGAKVLLDYEASRASAPVTRP